MRTEEFYNLLRQKSADAQAFEKVKKDIPLGLTEQGELVFSHTREVAYAIRHTCVTGEGYTAYIQNLILLLSALFGQDGACFLVLSPKSEYTRLLHLKNANITAPYVQTAEQFKKAKESVSQLIRTRGKTTNQPKLFLVLDGLESIRDAGFGKDLESYRELMELCRNTDVEVITGVSLMKSIFSGYPGAFVGVGNALVDLRGGGLADVTYVEKDVSLSQPTAITVPQEPTKI